MLGVLLRGFIKRDEFEQISVPLLEYVKGPLEKDLAKAGTTTEWTSEDYEGNLTRWNLSTLEKRGGLIEPTREKQTVVDCPDATDGSSGV